MNKSKIALIGLGYVGLPLAVEFGKKRTVIGFDINQNRIKELKQGLDVTLETTKQELKEYSEDLKEGEFEQMDLRYLRALKARLTA